jgi:outer membrane autotransporter protein
VAKAGNWQFIPSVGLRYLTLKNKSWSERINGVDGVPNWFAGKTDHEVDVPIQLKINTTLVTNSLTITTELRLGYTIVAKKPDNVMNVGFVGSSDTAQIHGVKSKRNTAQVGAGLKFNTGRTIDFFVNYDLDATSGYQSHNASIGLGLEY